VQDEVAFPSSMVDRITPATTDADRRLVRDRFGIDDRIPVMAEPFCQWVLEDRFPAGRPPLEDAGVQLVDDVRPYELMKLRLLNGGHQALAHFGHLLGHREVHAAARDPLLRRLLEHWFAEATPTLPPLPDVDLPAYTTTLLERFANPHISDTIARLCAFTSDRIPTFVLPVARDNLAAGRGSPIAAAIVAAWEAYRRVGDVVDRRASITFVADPVVFGDLGQDRRFVDAVDRARTEIGAHGPRQALVSLLAGAP
jgi:mannitol 2-dehydrogenase